MQIQEPEAIQTACYEALIQKEPADKIALLKAAQTNWQAKSLFVKKLGLNPSE